VVILEYLKVYRNLVRERLHLLEQTREGSIEMLFSKSGSDRDANFGNTPTEFLALTKTRIYSSSPQVGKLQNNTTCGSIYPLLLSLSGPRCAVRLEDLSLESRHTEPRAWLSRDD
jgi:hypothetical protein